MNDFDPVKLERIRRYGRADWRRFVRPDWERFVHPAYHAAMRKEFALYERAFETPLARRLRLKQEAREREQKEAREADLQREIEREARQLKAELAALRFELFWTEFCRKYSYNPNQPRVTAGHGIESGRWTDSGAGVRVAQYSIGTLVGQSLVRGRGWVCFYKFSFGTIMVPGTTNLGCQTWVPAAGVSHGRLIANDN